MNLLFLDVETTGIRDAHLVQVAYIHVPSGREYVGLYKPPIPIEDGAAAVTGIHNEHVIDCQPWEGSPEHAEVREFLKDSIFIAHNAKFDMRVISRYGCEIPKYICTMKLARYLLPQATNHKLENLFRELALTLPEGREAKAHDALGDILMMKELMRYFTVHYMQRFPDKTVEDAINFFVDYCQKPRLDKMPFGKHKGVKFQDLPADYVHWLKYEAGDMDEAVLYSLELCGR